MNFRKMVTSGVFDGYGVRKTSSKDIRYGIGVLKGLPSRVDTAESYDTELYVPWSDDFYASVTVYFDPCEDCDGRGEYPYSEDSGHYDVGWRRYKKIYNEGTEEELENFKADYWRFAHCDACDGLGNRIQVQFHDPEEKREFEAMTREDQRNRQEQMSELSHFRSLL